MSTYRSTVLNEQGAVNYTTHNPVGVAGLISPWNLPLYLLTFKIAPAIAAGNTVVCKPSEMTSVTAWMFAGVLNEAGNGKTNSLCWRVMYILNCSLVIKVMPKLN